MSSIYRKSRDGYFYYQTYAYNISTGKKDKRIYHSLGTKDEIIAKEKQLEYDIKYEKKDPKPVLKQVHNKNGPNYFTYIFSIAISAIISFFLGLVYFEDSQIENAKETVKLNNINNEQIILDSKDLTNYERPELLKQKKDTIQTNYAQVKRDALESYNIDLPNYTIERIEKLSEAFNQGKIFITVDEYKNKNSYLKLCKKVTGEFNQFANIVICLYSNSTVGKNLALGNELNYGTEEHKKAWLAMYTYNSVEGEYFDDNPSQHFGAN